MYSHFAALSFWQSFVFIMYNANGECFECNAFGTIFYLSECKESFILHGDAFVHFSAYPYEFIYLLQSDGWMTAEGMPNEWKSKQTCHDNLVLKQHINKANQTNERSNGNRATTNTRIKGPAHWRAAKTNKIAQNVHSLSVAPMIPTWSSHYWRLFCWSRRKKRQKGAKTRRKRSSAENKYTNALYII